MSFLANWLFVDAQKQIVVEFNNFNDFAASANLFAYKNGNEFSLISDTIINKKISFNIVDSIEPGMFTLKFNGNLPLNDIRIVYDGKNQIVKINAKPELNSIVVKGGGETEKYYAARNITDSITQRIVNLRRLIVSYNPDDDFAVEINAFIEKEIKTLANTYDDINTKYKGSLFLTYFNAGRSYVPAMWQSEDVVRADALKHFFDFFNPTDVLLMRSPVLIAKIEDFLNLSSSSTNKSREENLKNAVDIYMQKISQSDEAVNVSANIMRKWLNKYGFEAIMEYIDIQYLANQCDAGFDFNLQERLEAYRRLAPGKDAPEIAWLGSDNSIFMLSQLNAKKKIVVFWASWCPHCKVMLPQIYDYLKNKIEIKVIAVALDKEELPWADLMKMFQGWHHLRAVEEWNNETVKLYAVSATPAIFIITENNKIQKKVSNMEDFITEIEK